MTTLWTEKPSEYKNYFGKAVYGSVPGLETLCWECYAQVVFANVHAHRWCWVYLGPWHLWWNMCIYIYIYVFIYIYIYMWVTWAWIYIEMPQTWKPGTCSLWIPHFQTKIHLSTSFAGLESNPVRHNAWNHRPDGMFCCEYGLDIAPNQYESGRRMLDEQVKVPDLVSHD